MIRRQLGNAGRNWEVKRQRLLKQVGETRRSRLHIRHDEVEGQTKGFRLHGGRHLGDRMRGVMLLLAKEGVLQYCSESSPIQYR